MEPADGRVRSRPLIGRSPGRGEEAETGLAQMEKRAKLNKPRIGRHENGKA